MTPYSEYEHEFSTTDEMVLETAAAAASGQAEMVLR